ncbi:MAG: DUF2341 domain-containing protein [Methanosarcinales archaeon]|nr:DUF2341 domain-containing protein [Methanosarcinales archaeon]
MTYRILNIDLSKERINEEYNLYGNNIKVISATSDCFIQLNSKTEDPINLKFIKEIKGKFKKFYLSNAGPNNEYIYYSNMGLNKQYIKIIVSEDFGWDNKINIHKSIPTDPTPPPTDPTPPPTDPTPPPADPTPPPADPTPPPADPTPPPAEPVPPFLTGFNFRIPITIPHTKVTTNEVNCPVYIRLRQANFNFANAQNNGNDIRFTKDDGQTLLNFERDRHDGVNLKGDYIVKIPNISSINDTKFFMYYGNPNATDGANPTAVWDANFMGRWSLKEDPTGIAPQMKDSTANNNHGTVHGGMTAANSVEGQIGRALDFDGVNDKINIPNTILPNSHAFTISGWFFNKGENATTENWQVLVDLRGQYSIFILLNEQDDATNPGAIRFWIHDGTTSYNLFSSNISINTWCFFTATWDGTNMRIYINGVEVGNKIAANPTTNTTQSRIGKDNTTINRGWFNGIIDEIRISNITRSSSWVDLQYKTQKDTLLNYGVEESNI